MTKRIARALRISACPRCGGTAYLEGPDENEWRCLQCARSVPAPRKAVVAPAA